MQQISPVAHWPVVLSVLRKLNVAAPVNTFCSPHLAHVLSCIQHLAEAVIIAGLALEPGL